MRRLFAIAASTAILLALLVPTALAAEPVTAGGSVILSVDGSVDVPAGQRVETVVVIDGSARIAGTVDTLVVAGGTATLAGATVDSLLVVDGAAVLGPGTTVTGDVGTLRGTVTQDAGAVVRGSVRALDTDLAALALLAIPFLVVLFVGVGLAALVAALVVAAFGARQVRGAGALISDQPGLVLVAGIAGTVAFPALGILLVMTVIGAPIGLGLLLVVLPAIVFLGWIVAAIWIGDWLVARMRGSREPDRPYLAALLGVIVLAVAGVLPFVTAIATLFGFGALLLAAWRVLRPAGPSLGRAAAGQPAPSSPGPAGQAA